MSCEVRLQLLNPGGNAGLHLVQPFDELDELGTALVLKLVRIATEDRLEDGQELRGELPDVRVFPLVYKLVSNVLARSKQGGITYTAGRSCGTGVRSPRNRSSKGGWRRGLGEHP